MAGRKVPDFQDFLRSEGREKRHRSADSDDDVLKRREVRCSCCSRVIDLRTVHCGDCCDKDRRLRDGPRRSHRRSGESESVEKRPQYLASDDEKDGGDTRRKRKGKDVSDLVVGADHVKNRRPKYVPPTFVKEGQLPVTDDATSSSWFGSGATKLRGNEHRNSAVNEEDDLVDLSIA